MGIKFLSPWVFRIAIFMGRLILNTVASLWVGVPVAVERISRDWMGRAVAAGIPTEYDTILYYLFKGVGYAMILGGWIGFSYLTVGLLAFLF